MGEQVDTDAVREFYAHDVLAVDPGAMEDCLYALCDELDRLRAAADDLLDASGEHAPVSLPGAADLCGNCTRPWPCPAERARALLDGGPT